MPRFTRALAATALAVAALARAQDVTTTTVPPPPTQTTKVQGTLPADLAGRWLAVPWIELPGGKTSTTPRLFTISGSGEQMTLTQQFVTLPPAPQQAIDAANAARTPWEPTPEDLRAIAGAQDSAAPFDPGLRTSSVELIGEDAFDETIRNEPRAAGAKWLLRFTETYRPSPTNRSLKQVAAFAVTGPRDGDWVGGYSSVHVAAAPLPVPISLNGSFRLYRLDGAGETAEKPERGFLVRLADQLIGCGSR
jgi:hypothetical protein